MEGRAAYEAVLDSLRSAWQVEFKNAPDEEACLMLIEKYISSWIAAGPVVFFQKMYRIDIEEHQLQAVLQDPERRIQRLAALIYKRQLEKINTRAYYRRTQEESDPDLSW